MTYEQTVLTFPPVTDVATGRPTFDRPRRTVRGISAAWSSLTAPVRLMAVGMAATGVALVVISAVLSAEARSQFLEARGAGVAAVAHAIEPEIPSLRDGTSLTPLEIDAIESVRDRFMPEAVFVKIWSLDGTILYADDPALVGTSSVARRPHLAAAVDDGLQSRLVDEGASRPAFIPTSSGSTVEHYVVLHDDAGREEAVLTVFEELAPQQAGLNALMTTMRLSTIAGIALLFIGPVMLLVVRHRAAVGLRDRELALLAEAADATAAAIEPAEVADALRLRLAGELRLTRFEIAHRPTVETVAFIHPLVDGSALVADRADPMTPEQRRILHAAGRALDAAIANHRTFEEIQAAHARASVLATRPAGSLGRSERESLVGELHDTVGAKLMRTLYAVRRAGMIGARRSDELCAAIQSIEAMVEDTEAHLRAFLATVSPRPIEADRLDELVARSAWRFESESGIRARYRVSGDVTRLNEEFTVVLARAVDEALTNVLKHAGDASLVTVALLVGRRSTKLRVTDDGRGPCNMPRPARSGHGIGLAYLRERVHALGGTVRIVGGPTRGARLEISVPTGGPA